MQLFGRYTLTVLLFAAELVFALSNKKLSQLSSKNGGIIPLTNSNYQKVLSDPMDSYMLVLLTATNPHVNCVLCKELEPDYQLLAESWFKDHPDGLEGETKETGLFFAKADFIDPNSNEVFVHYQITNVPRLFLFRPGGNLDTFASLGVPSKAGADRVLALIEELKAETGFTDYRIHQAFNWGSFFITVGITMLTVALLKQYNSVIWTIASYRPVWGVACVSFIITLITGTMFNKIRETPYVGVSKDGNEPMYFAMKQQQFQFGVETQIMSFIYGTLVVGFILLTLMVPKISDYYRKNNKPACTTICLIASLGFSVVIFISFSALVAVFKLKNGEYPFKLFSLT